MHLLLMKLICIIVISTLCFQSVCPAHVCHCIRIKDCVPFVQLLLNHKPEERASVFSKVHSAGCGFQGLDPLACCPQASTHYGRSSRFAPTERWVWDTSSSSKHNPRVNFHFNRFLAHETEMQLLDYRDFEAQRNCPQPIEEDYDEHRYKFGSGHHFHFHIDHDMETAEEVLSPTPADKPIVFPGDLRFQHTTGLKDQVELLANANQDNDLQNNTPMPATTPPAVTPTSSAAMLNSADCGISVNTRLVGGDEVVPGQYPWFARIAYRNRTNNRISYRCSGALIAKNYVLTAAHCVVNLVNDLEIFQVRIGDDISSPQDCAPSTENCTKPNIFNIIRILVHPNYDQPKYANDIALLGLNNISSKFTPICLPLNSTAALADRMIGQMGVVAGWSTKAETNTSNSSSSSGATVRFIRLPIVNTTSCAITYATLSENFQQPIVITPNHLCAQGQPMKDVCRGDSGGPFMDDGTSGILNADGRHTLLGIVAFGPTLCGVTTIPGVYTAVSSYINWIFDSINMLNT